MTLAEYLDARKGETNLTLMAGELGVSVGRLSQIKTGDTCSVKLALAIEQLTNGLVDAASLSSDVAMTRAV